MSSEAKFTHRVNMVLDKIQQNSPINRYVLCRMLQITPKQYESMHPYLVEAYQDKIEFSNVGKTWTWIGEAPKMPETLEEALKDNNNNDGQNQ